MGLRWVLVTVIVIVLAIAAVACTREPPGIHAPGVQRTTHPEVLAFVTVDDLFTSYDARAIVRGVTAWDRASNGHVVVNVVPSFDDVRRYVGIANGDRCIDVISVNLVTSLDRFVRYKDDLHPQSITLGFARYDRCSVSNVWLVVDRLYDDDILSWVAMHEFGHAIGLNHTRDKDTVMFKTYLRSSSSRCLTRPDMDALCDMIGCDVDDTRYCVN